MLCNLVFLYLQERCHFRIILWISLARIECNDVAELCALEEFLLVFHLNILWHHHRSLYGYTAFECVSVCVELAEVALQHIALLCVIAIYGLVVACTACEHIHLLVDELVVNLNFVVVNSIFICQLGLELGSHSDVKLEHVRCLTVFYIHRFLCLVRHRLSEHLNLIVYDVFLEVFSDDFVDCIHLHRCTNLAFNHFHRSLSRTESRNVCLLAIILECLLYFFFVICLFNSQSHQTVDFVGIFK